VPGETAADTASGARDVHELLVLLAKAQKSLRLYQGTSPVVDRLESDLFSRLVDRLEADGPLNLSIREFQILHDEQVVYDNRDRNDSLAFLLFRDGVRRLSFHPGIQPGELHGLLDSLSRVAVAGSQQDDIVTLLWEQDFTAIRYFAVEELSSEGQGPRLEQQLASRSTGAQAAEGAPGAVSVTDLEQPLSQLPVSECRLSDQEVAALRSELTREGEGPFWARAVELGVELMLLETAAADRQNLITCLLGIVDQHQAAGDVVAVAAVPEHVSGLASVFGDARELPQVEAQLMQALAEPARLSRFLELAGSSRDLSPAELTAYVARLGNAALETSVAWLELMPNPTLRRALAQAVVAMGSRGAARLVPRLVGGAEADALDAGFLREAHFVLTQLPAADVLPQIPMLLASGHTEVRREAARLLGRFREDAAETLCLELLADADPQVRGPALDTLVRHERRDLAHAVLERATASSEFDGWDAQEKRRLFLGVAKLAGDDAIDWFSAYLVRQDRRWFAGRSSRDVREAAAHGLRMLASSRALERLRELAASGDRHVRAACLKELEQAGA